jgi:hypothetical protein
MDNYPQIPPNLKVYRNRAGDECKGFLVGLASTMSVFWNVSTEKQEIGFEYDVNSCIRL